MADNANTAPANDSPNDKLDPQLDQGLKDVVDELQECAFRVGEWADDLTSQWFWDHAASKGRLEAMSLYQYIDDLIAKLAELRNSAPRDLVKEAEDDRRATLEYIELRRKERAEGSP